MSQALYRKHRSQNLNEIVGQPHVVSVLSKSLSKGIVSHAYLFTGPRGVGKTSVARILARSINGLKSDEDSLDIIEIDAASNNGVDNIRDLREKAQIAPVSANKKIYIIDEVHMLSPAAFNALLKTLEEPPAHVAFILATTNLDKLPDTIVSRTQHFTFRSIPVDVIAKHLTQIAKSEKILISNEAIKLIAHQSNGGMRDAISLLDQLSSLSEKKSEITPDLVVNILGVAPAKSLQKLLDDTVNGNIDGIKTALDDLSEQGVSDDILLNQLINQTLEQSIDDPVFMSLLNELSKINRKDDYVGIRIFTVLGLFNKHHLKFKDSARTPLLTKKTEPVADKTKPKSVPQAVTTPASLSINVSGDIKKNSLSEFNWDEIIKLLKDNHMALGSLMVKCQYELIEAEQKLILYTLNKFNKKKIDDPKYLTHLYSTVQNLGFSDLSIETLPTGKPPKSGAMAKVADIMGGGEVVEIKEVDV